VLDVSSSASWPPPPVTAEARALQTGLPVIEEPRPHPHSFPSGLPTIGEAPGVWPARPRRGQGRRIITFGTFDLFHIGHLNLITRAAALGDHLIVGVSSDELNLRKKGFLPLFPLRDRLAIVAALRQVDEVFVEESLELKRHYIHDHHADALVMGADWEGKFDDLLDACEVVYLPRTDHISTTSLKERMRHPL
jgi:choline-phosphate cytidylyltransferase